MNGSDNCDREPILSEYTENGSIQDTNKEASSDSITAVYARRWYMVMMFSLLSFMQSAVWNTWGPVADTAQAVYGWSDFQVGMFGSIANIAFVFTAFPAAWVMDVVGLRTGVVGCSILVVIATGIRCIPMSNSMFTWVANISSILNGIAGTVPFSGPPTISALWFPMEERTTATAIAAIFSYVGSATGFIVGPLVVKEYFYFPQLNKSESINQSSVHDLLSDNQNNLTDPFHIQSQKHDIQNLMYIEFACSSVLLVALLIYFPSRPPKPPSLSASVKRLDFKNGICNLVKNTQFWFILFAYALPTGVYGTWGTVIDDNLAAVGVSQKEAGWLSFYSIIGGAISALAVAWLADKPFLRQHVKIVLYILITGSCLSVIWFCLLVANIIPFGTVQLYIATIMGGVFINSTVPLSYELAVESCYPIAEGITTGMLTLFNNLFGSLFILMLAINNIGTAWMNWVLLGSIVIVYPPLILFKEKHGRSAVDTEKHVNIQDTQQNNQSVIGAHVNL